MHYGFNEAALSRARKEVRPRWLCPEIQGASMRPRSVERGKSHGLGSNGSSSLGFNEAALSRARKVSAITGRPRVRRRLK